MKLTTFILHAVITASFATALPLKADPIYYSDYFNVDNNGYLGRFELVTEVGCHSIPISNARQFTVFTKNFCLFFTYVSFQALLSTPHLSSSADNSLVTMRAPRTNSQPRFTLEIMTTMA